MLLVSRTTLWRRGQNLESFSNRYTTTSDAELVEGVFTVLGDLILFGTLMDYIASSVGGS